MRRDRLFAAAIVLIVGLARPIAVFSQDNSAQETKETYAGEPLCHPGRGAFPHPTYQPEPAYDDKDRKKKTQGTVTLSIIVTKEGQAADVKVVNTLTPGLDQQAIKAVSRWRFNPGTKDGEPCPVRVSIQVQFKLY